MFYCLFKYQVSVTFLAENYIAPKMHDNRPSLKQSVKTHGPLVENESLEKGPLFVFFCDFYHSHKTSENITHTTKSANQNLNLKCL